MATAKKVALSSVEKKGRTRAKASVATPKKKSSTKKVSAKKTTLAVSAKNVASKKIQIQNNTKQTAKTTARTRSTKKTIDSKLAHIEHLHAKKAKAPVVATKKGGLPIQLPSMQLALLSPYRFPMLTEKGVTTLARASGVFFVLVGALFTLFYSNGFFSNASQLALLGSATEIITTTTESAGNCLSGSGCSLPLEQQKPKAQISLQNAESLTGSAQIKVKVAEAQSVVISAYSEQRKQEFTLGSASKVSSDAWEMYWDTAQYDDGVYTVKARIQNKYGVYESVFGTPVRVQNVADTSTNTASTDAQNEEQEEEIRDDQDDIDETDDADGLLETVTDTVKEAVASTAVVLSSNTATSDTSITFTVQAKDVDKVQLFARKDGDTKRNAIGIAYKASDDSWKYRWSLRDIAVGSYAITAVAFDNGLEFTSPSITVSKKESQDIVNTVADAIAPITSTLPVTTTPTLTPDIEVSVEGQSTLSKIAPIRIEAEGIRSVDVFVQPSNTLTQRYLGTATKANDTVWTYAWDTTRSPNGTYTVVAYVRNAYGTYTGESRVVTVQNVTTPTYTEAQQQKVDTLTSIAKEIASVPVTVEAPKLAPTAPSNTPSTDTATTSASAPVTTQTPIDVSTIKPKIDSELQKLTTVLRSQDQTAISHTRESIEAIKTELLQTAQNEEDKVALQQFVDTQLANAVTKVEEEVKRSERFIAERTGDEAKSDSDKDGITDFDEVALYNTDPFSADTDSDGFTDGSEILSGFDPRDAEGETLVAFESPKETGVVRDDIFKVTGIAPAQKNPEEPETVAPAIISGTALPNSFVTLYIFSTPVVVTVKTDADGSWSYRLDKKLEDGEHQVFVGVTDNSGKIVAKSSPFTFIKEAQAFTPANAQEAETAPVQNEERSFISTYMVYLVLSISVVAIGLVLILLGIYIDPKQRKEEEPELDGVPQGTT